MNFQHSSVEPREKLEKHHHLQNCTQVTLNVARIATVCNYKYTSMLRAHTTDNYK